MKIVQLHHHSEYSIKHGLTTISEIIDFVKENKDKYYPAISLTDFTNAGSWNLLNKSCEKNGFKSIFGQEFDVEVDYKKGFTNHITALAKNDQGIKNLIWLHNHAWSNFYYIPRIKKEWLKEKSEGIVWLTGDINSELSGLVLQNKKEEAEGLLREYQKMFEDLYIEIIVNDYRAYVFINKSLLNLSRSLKIPHVITNDGRYIKKEHSEAYKVWLLSGQQLTEKDRNKLDDYTIECENLYYYSYGDYLSIAKKYNFFESIFDGEKEFNEGLENTIKIAEVCNAKLDTSVKLPKIENSREIFKEKVTRGFKEKGLEERHMEQLLKECKVISKIGLEDYFLIMNDIAEFCNENKILRGDRGSCAASLVSYCLDITSFDPTKHKLLMFDRFLSEERVNPVWKDGKFYMSDAPDIDFDAEPSKRDLIKEYLKNKYG